MTIFDDPENIFVLVVVLAAVLFFLCFYCSFIQPVFNFIGYILKCISRVICCSRRSQSIVV